MNEDNLNLEEKPFLNRFEKQLFSIDNIFDKQELDLIHFSSNIIESFVKNYEFNMDYISKDLLYLILMKNIEKQNESERNKIFWNLLIQLFPQEMIYYLNNNKIGNNKHKDNINLTFKNYYKKNYNFASFLSNTNSQFNTIYTYSRINIPLFDNNEIKIVNKFLDIEFSPKKTKTFVNNFKIINYLVDENKYNLYIIYFSFQFNIWFFIFLYFINYI